VPVFVQLSKSSQAHPIRRKQRGEFGIFFYMMKNKSTLNKRM